MQRCNSRRRWAWGLLFLASLILCLGIARPSTRPVQAADARQLVQQGVNYYQAGALPAAIEVWQRALAVYAEGDDENAAVVLENLARAHQQLGQTQPEIQYWQQAAERYRRLNDAAQWGRMLTEQAQTLVRLGQSRQAIALLCGGQTAQTCTEDSAVQLARGVGDRLGEAAALGSLGEAYRIRADYEQAIQLLSASQSIALAIGQPAYRTAALNGLGSAHLGLAQANYRRSTTAEQLGDARTADALRQAGRQQDAIALEYFQQSLTLAQQQGDGVGQMRALLNAIPVDYRIGNAVPLPRAIALLETLPDSRDKAYAAIELASLLEPTAQTRAETRCLSAAVQPQAAALLQQAVAIGQRLGDSRSQSFALGALGHLYECQQDYAQALDLTQQARWAAEQDLRAKDSLYRWEWQAGRILKAQGKSDEAIAAYEQAIATLETIRSDLLIANRDLQFDFRDTVDPVYRQLIALRLEQPFATAAGSVNIDAALKTLDSLKLAELQNYFGDDCLILDAATAPASAIAAESATAVFSSVILDERTAIIATFPSGEQRIAWIEVDRDALRAEINNYRKRLERFFENFNPQQAEKVYGWIIAPFAEALDAAQIKTLVFVQDGILRSVPMSVLYDGDRFLIQKYAIATTPSLTLTDAQPLDRRSLRALALGLTQAAQIEGQSFPPLSNVGREIAAIAAELPGSRALLNQDFTRDRLQQELTQSNYSIVHMATHGQFGADPESTFLVTGDRQKLTISDLDAILRQTSIDRTVALLVLTACQTAAGDDRSTLGLAGVAVQAGVGSALASLWFVDDAATAEIATQFYSRLSDPHLSRAEALRAAQVAMIEAGGITARPAFWAPFILIGSWL